MQAPQLESRVQAHGWSEMLTMARSALRWLWPMLLLVIAITGLSSVSAELSVSSLSLHVILKWGMLLSMLVFTFACAYLLVAFSKRASRPTMFGYGLYFAAAILVGEAIFVTVFFA